jgi:calpain-7
LCIINHTTNTEGAAKDMYNLGNNPQYNIHVNAGSATTFWLLLSRHITDIEDFAENKEYITLHVYKSTESGDRVRCSF